MPVFTTGDTVVPLVTLANRVVVSFATGLALTVLAVGATENLPLLSMYPVLVAFKLLNRLDKLLSLSSTLSLCSTTGVSSTKLLLIPPMPVRPSNPPELLAGC